MSFQIDSYRGDSRTINEILQLVHSGKPITGLINKHIRNIRVVDALIALGVDVNERCGGGKKITPLMSVLYSYRIPPHIKPDRIEHLLNHGANPWLRDGDGDDLWDNALAIWKYNRALIHPLVIVKLVRLGIMRGKLSRLPIKVKEFLRTEMIMVALCIPNSLKYKYKMEIWMNQDVLRKLRGFLG